MFKKLVCTLTSLFPIDPRRSGACTGCGACCKLPYRCPFLTVTSEGKARCRIYRLRPPNCRKYPRTAKEWITRSTCGFRFPDTDNPSES